MKWYENIQTFLIASVPGGIEAQEAAGQADLVADTILPSKVNYGTKAQFEAMGIVFGNPVDNLFVEAKLPIGWKKEATGHSLWSNLLDDKGRERATIFYKAAFYDRDAFLSILRRFSYHTQPVGGYGDDSYDYDTHPRECVVIDCGKVIWQSKPLAMDGIKPWQASDILNPQGKAWLDEHYPNWEDPTAYWDED